ncbi:MAG TPA: carboxypeptidase-like regulatory domain-containing protein [Verrucomicrobiae bacterium]|nr:carboxypeptidase-like regulatory domain-containing protein [Verrucomicrobiae bacterium]
MQSRSLKRFTQLFLLLALCFGLGVLNVSAQVSNFGSVTVTVLDPTGATVPGAQLEIKDLSTNIVRKAVTGAQGSYTFPDLTFGNYSLTISAKGFQNQVFSSVQVQTARNTDIHATMKVGASTETVTVTTDAVPLVEPESSVLSDTIDTKQVVNLPIQGRSMFALSFLVPGWASSGPGSTAGTWDNLPGGAIVSADFDGTPAISNRFRSGGFTYGTSVVTPRIEDIAEMTVQTSQLDLSGNGTSAMKISIVTRRGSNNFHGRAFEDFQNTDLNSNSWLNNARGIIRPVSKLNDFGFSVGGPIWKNKLFFFGTYAESKAPGASIPTATILSAGAQAGIFQYKAANGSIQSVNVLNIGGAAGGPTAINSSIASQFTTINGVLKDGSLSPTSDPNISTLSWAYPNAVTTYYPALRFDYNATEKLRFNFSYSQTKTQRPGNYTPNFPGGIDPTDATSSNGNNKIGGLGIDYTIKPTLINQFHLGFMYQYSAFSPENQNLNGATVVQQFWGYGESLYGGSYPRQSISSYYPMISFTDSLNWQRGNHTIIAGGGGFHEQDHYWNGAGGGYPGISLGITTNDPILTAFQSSLSAAGLTTAQQSSAEALYATLVGRVSSVAIDGGGRPLDVKTKQYKPFGAYNLDESMYAGNFFVQDRWRLSPNLTINYGLRWDLVGADHDINGLYSSPASIADLWGPTPVGAIFQPGTLGGVANPQFTAKQYAYKGSWVNPQPAIALAWSPKTQGFLAKIFPSEKTVIRTGYSLRMYQEGAQNFWAFASNSGAFFYQLGGLSADTSGAVGTYSPGSLYLGQTLPAFRLNPASWAPQIPASQLSFGNVFYGMNPNIRQPYVESWNFGIERELGKASAIEVRYVGNLSLHTWFSENLNEANIFENGFLQEFNNARNNLAVANGISVGQLVPGVTLKTSSFANQGLPGQVPLPIFAAAFATTSGSLYNQFTTQLESGAVGSVANTLSRTQSYICNMFGSKLIPCANLGLGGAGTSYPINFFNVNPIATGSSVNYLDAMGTANYNSLQVDFRQRVSHGMQFAVNYTLSHSLVEGPVNGYQANAGGSFITDRNFRLSYRPSSYDIRNIFHANGTYDLPFGKGQHFLNGSKIADEVLGHWTLGTIIIMQSGLPTQISGGYLTFTGSGGSGADGGVLFAPGVTGQTIQNNIGVYRTGNAWVETINPKLLAANGGVNPSSAYAPNIFPGIIGSNPFVYGPHWFNADMSINKSIPLRESIRLTLQGEFLNVFNHTAFTMGGIGAQSLSFGQSTGTFTSPRRIEIRANIEF